MTPLLQIENIGMRFGALEVLQDVSLDIHTGEFVSILGPSGAGKTTLFRLLLGEAAPSAGRIALRGVPLDREGGSFAYMPQRDALMPWRRILDNVTLGLEVRGVARKAARERVRPHLAEFGLEGFERHFPNQLSGGMRQRAALLRTIVQDRAALLLDEPFGALDALTRMRMQGWLESLWMRHRWTGVLITHDVREAVVLSDRIHVLSARPGRIVRSVRIDLPRPRMGMSGPRARAIEDELFKCLITETQP